MQARKNLVQGGSVEAFLVLEVIIEQSFVHACAAGNLIRARARNAFMREFFQSSLQDSGAGFLGLAAGARLAGFDGRGH